MVSQDVRNAIEAEQEQLLGALLNIEPVPAGFSSKHVRVAAQSLSIKRCRTVGRCWPHLRESLGADFQKLFCEYTAVEQPIPYESPALDGYHFIVRLLRDGRVLSDDSLSELLHYEVNFDENGMPRRFSLGCRFLPGRRTLAFAFKWTAPPWLSRQRDAPIE